MKIPKQTLWKELNMSVKVGSSKGWVALSNLNDLKLHLTNVFNPFASSSRKVLISLPPVEKIYRGSIARVWNVAFSASPDEEDCVVAAKLNAPFISLCRPGDSEWTYIETPMSFFTSVVMYSKRDRRFYLLSSNISGTDLIKTCSDFPPVSLYQRFPFSDIPKSTKDLIQSCVLRNQYLVEAPSGESFIVFW
ncbi:hypothetical protein V5N11_012155 [Cardamine amara subsp. amara]|uniref:KIB1-4 beta-propeller domain-containing protein n=1 Tax=Cardamine amara subsp. amara TaxID=228776 RepID=A0ABD1AFJ3_CARAN